jgi:hypothetical protein
VVGVRPLQVGSEVRISQPRLGTTRWLVTELEPDRRFTWVTGVPGLQGRATHEVEAAGSGSRATLRVEHAGLFAPVVRLLTGGLTRRYLGYEAEGLKARAEGRA